MSKATETQRDSQRGAALAECALPVWTQQTTAILQRRWEAPATKRQEQEKSSEAKPGAGKPQRLASLKENPIKSLTNLKPGRGIFC